MEEAKKDKRTEDLPPTETVAAGEVQVRSPDIALGADPGISLLFLTWMCLAAISYPAADKG